MTTIELPTTTPVIDTLIANHPALKINLEDHYVDTSRVEHSAEAQALVKHLLERLLNDPQSPIRLLSRNLEAQGILSRLLRNLEVLDIICAVPSLKEHDLMPLMCRAHVDNAWCTALTTQPIIHFA